MSRVEREGIARVEQRQSPDQSLAMDQHSQNQNSTESNWNWVGVATPDSANRIQIPPALNEAGIFENFTEATWGFETKTGAFVISPERLDIERYKSVEPRTIGSKKDGFRCQIPHQYLSEGSGTLYYDIQKVNATVEGTEAFHFIYHDEIFQRRTPWCYVLTTSELEQRLLRPEAWVETVFPEVHPK